MPQVFTRAQGRDYHGNIRCCEPWPRYWEDWFKGKVGDEIDDESNIAPEPTDTSAWVSIIVLALAYHKVQKT